MKFKALTLAVAAAAMPYGVSAAGLNPTGSFDAILYLAGASAEDNLLFDSTLKDICGDNISVLNKPDTTQTPHKLGNYFGVACTAKTSSSVVDSSILGKNILILKRSAGGSAFGVNTLLENPPRRITQIDRSSCVLNGTYTSPIPSVGTVDNYSCVNTTSATDIAADAGISDVNPEMFRGVNRPAGFTDVVASDAQTKFGRAVRGVVAQGFGIVVTTNLRDALQVAQFGSASSCATPGHADKETEKCMPSLSKALVNSILLGRVTDWSWVQVPNSTGTSVSLTRVAGVTAPRTNGAKICRRVAGSGTQATINAVLLNSPCTNTNGTPLSVNNTNVALGSGSSDVDKCLQAWNSGVSQSIATDGGSFTVNSTGTAATPIRGWAIGVQGLEKASTHYRFVKLDGVAPTLQNIHSGLYPVWAEATIQFRVDGLNALSVQPGGAMKVAVVNSIRNVIGSASNLAALNSLLPNPAYLALSSVTGQVPDAVYRASNPVVPFTHTATNTDACRTPIMTPNTTYRTKTPLGF